MDDTPAFIPHDGQWKVKGRGIFYAVKLDRETEDFAHLKNQTVRLYTKDRGVIEATCTGIEKFMHMPPWRKGEQVGLLIDEASIVPAG